MTGVSISGVGHCGNFQPGTAIEAFTLSRNHALAIEEICNLALSAWFLESAANLLLGSTCMSADVPDPIDSGRAHRRLFDRFFKGAIAPSRELYETPVIAFYRMSWHLPSTPFRSRAFLPSAGSRPLVSIT
jgi:hypothetical protein